LGLTKSSPIEVDSGQQEEKSVSTSVPTGELTEKRKFSLDFFKFRKGSKGKFDLLGKKRGSSSSIASTDSKSSRKSNASEHDGSRRNSTRMEGTSDLAAWCI
jgi:hypothetical protein